MMAFDRIIVGGGIYGTALAWRCALRGLRVAVVTVGSPGAEGSGSGDKSRIVRGLYDRAHFVESGLKGLDLWAAWSTELSVPLWRKTGVWYIDRNDGKETSRAFSRWLDAGIRHLAERGATVSILSATEAKKRCPAMATGDIERVVVEPGAGIGYASRACRALARAAWDTGDVEFRDAAVTGLLLEGGRATGVRIGDEQLHAPSVILAAGAGGAELVRAEVGVDLGIRRLGQFTSYWDVPWPSGRDLLEDRTAPFADLSVDLYGFPDDGEAGFKIAFHEPLAGAQTEPADDATARAHIVSRAEAVRERAAARFPALATATLRTIYQCQYDATVDEEFVIGEIPGATGLSFVGGMSGHGYKHAPAIAESVVQRLHGETPMVDLTRYAPKIPSS